MPRSAVPLTDVVSVTATEDYDDDLFHECEFFDQSRVESFSLVYESRNICNDTSRK